MFLQHTSYFKPTQSTPSQPNPLVKNPSHTFDQFAFTDFFIRKHPKKGEFNLNKQSPYQNLRNLKTKHQNQSQTIFQHDTPKQKNNKQMAIFCLPNKKPFQIKFLHHKNKQLPQTQQAASKKDIPTKTKELSYQRQNNKGKQELIRQRKNASNHPVYTPRPSTKYTSEVSRYSMENGFYGNQHVRWSEEVRKDEEVQFFQKQDRRSIEMCVTTSLGQSPNKLNEGDDLKSGSSKKDRYSLTAAYKVKSLVLGRNPKEEQSSKSKKVIGRIYDRKQSAKGVNNYRTKSQKVSDTKIPPAQDEDIIRNSTEYRSSNVNEGRSQNQSHMSVGKYRLGGKGYENNRKSVKLTNIFKKLEGDFDGQELSLQPWNKGVHFSPWNRGLDIDYTFHDPVQESPFHLLPDNNIYFFEEESTKNYQDQKGQNSNKKEYVKVNENKEKKQEDSQKKNNLNKDPQNNDTRGSNHQSGNKMEPYSAFELNELDMMSMDNHASRRNSFRKIYSTKQNPRLKSTILSEK